MHLKKALLLQSSLFKLALKVQNDDKIKLVIFQLKDNLVLHYMLRQPNFKKRVFKWTTYASY